MKNVLLLCGAVSIAAFVAVTANHGSSAPPPPPPQARVTKPEPLTAAPETNLDGEVREAMDVAQYTYLRLATPDGRDVWAAVSKAPVSVGSRVSIIDAMRMTSFESTTLKRTFDVIYFGNLGSTGRAPEPTGPLPPGHPPLAGQDVASSPHGPAAALPVSSAKVAPAAGKDAYDIAALFSQRASLEGKPARVRGHLIKATPVQGVTYYRIRDGSSQEPASAELVVSSTAKATPGAVVTFEGTVRTNVDVGIGVKYPVMLQDAQLAE
jgi:hypothetical protein